MFGINKDIKQLSPLEGEDFEDYAMRLYRHQTLLGLTNQEVSDLLNMESGNDYDESAYRKKYKLGVKYYDRGYFKGYSDGVEENSKVSVRQLDQELQKQKEEYYKVKRQMQDQNREYRNMLTLEARSAHLKDVIRDSVYIIEEKYPLLNTENKNIPSNKERVAILMLSDWHYGEVFSDYLNTFNHDIFVDRLERLVMQTKQYCELMNITNLKVLNLGDLVSGDIHVSTRVNNESDVITQVEVVSEMMAQMLDDLSENMYVDVYTVTDNHARTNKNKQAHIERESFARFIPFWLDARFRDHERVTIHENTLDGYPDYEIGVVDILGEKGIFVHGHNDNVNRVVPELSTMLGVIPIAVFMGHFHHNFEKEYNKIDLIGNSSLIGDGNYSKRIRKSSLPRQKLVVFNKEDDKVCREATFFVGI